MKYIHKQNNLLYAPDATMDDDELGAVLFAISCMPQQYSSEDSDHSAVTCLEDYRHQNMITGHTSIA